MAVSGKQSPVPEQPEHLDVIETPTSPSSCLARSRFEFETDKRNEGTKILMVEWEDTAPEVDGSADQTGESSDWEVTWEGKGAVLPVRDVDPEADSNLRRVYFLLPPGAPIPPLVEIKRRGKSTTATDGTGNILRTKPMPAIFPAELTSQQDAGRRGVLHTIWAKRRLAELQAEIAAEMRTNGESVGLEMAIQERQWIIDHFGLVPDPDMPQPTKLHLPQSSAVPASPRSPVGGRLGEKLKGLKLATSPAELAAASQVAKSAPRAPPSITSLSPPATSVSTAPGLGQGGVASLDAVVGAGVAPAPPAKVCEGDDANEEDLFALPMSPRSPEMKRSPFSIL
ncbi:hypothetical protein MYCTH_2296504 [Thermothelomyces thermophilus ATCC 42464]|uniref:Uncharacterized protein n=1 Tax=Thermothelomyces thermophilus (strain ATCC 42464 / BCRC 31852 / DSM 1799) TaxID=573729 RepID=G2Q1W9_THET4|nr:uncharacterized protein MYCTH_2296504 [Thermothelomyces thermophilus ATCC 42464]AEO54201.1 hypothetical protein MYCTH_2296504 [Thermothelomyces thermophilus ATCC 42464]